MEIDRSTLTKFKEAFERHGTSYFGMIREKASTQGRKIGKVIPLEGDKGKGKLQKLIRKADQEARPFSIAVRGDGKVYFLLADTHTHNTTSSVDFGPTR